jgi:hypothetical protein
LLRTYLFSLQRRCSCFSGVFELSWLPKERIMTPPSKHAAISFAGAIFVVFVAGFCLRRTALAQPGTTPGMLFGPMLVDKNQHLELCSSYLSAGTLTEFVHFRNLTTGEVTAAQQLTIPSGGGACVSYVGQGRVLGLARGNTPESEWFSPNTALVGTMSLVDGASHGNHEKDDGKGGTVAVVVGVAKIWLLGF